MTTNEPTAVEAIDVTNPRAVRALTECMTVLPTAPGMYDVVGQHGATYTVDAHEGRCTCPDAEYNLDDDERCKHQFRTAVVTGRLALPAWVDLDAVDDLLGVHADARRRIVDTTGARVFDTPRGRSAHTPATTDGRAA